MTREKSIEIALAEQMAFLREQMRDLTREVTIKKQPHGGSLSNGERKDEDIKLGDLPEFNGLKGQDLPL